MRATDELVEKHLKTIKIPTGLEKPTQEIVKRMISHPAFNNSK